MPTTARSRLSFLPLLAAAGVLLAACAGEATAPSSSPMGVTGSPANRALAGAVDGVYTFEIDPTQSQSLAIGASHLELPANAICDIAASSYGPGTWNDGCSLQQEPVTITATVTDAATDHPRIDFQPALRFSPNREVMLYIAVTDEATLNNSKVVKYCNEAGCVDESLSDSSLVSHVDENNLLVFRRIKHFSGYVVAEFAGISIGLGGDF
jgi:hypothetical protein